MSILHNRIKEHDSKVYRPVFYSLPDQEDELNTLLKENEDIEVLDTYEVQLNELIESRHPKGMSKDQFQKLKQDHVKKDKWEHAGQWVFYPWNRKLIHILGEDDFIELRTNRNQYKITSRERDLLQQRTVGIIGLSVGQSIALTLAMERNCGHLKLADFDHLELSNLNRIRTPLHNIGILKVIATAREIAEIDPYLTIEVYTEGVTSENLTQFIEKGQSLDLLVDECDSLDIKLLAREKARDLGIPVVMDTSDRGMLDIERFDLEPERPLFHGLAGNLSASEMKDLSNAEKLPYILKILGADDLSARAKASALEVNQSLTTWPQLASSVFLGGAAAADVVRRILLDQIQQSGRFFIDIESIIPSMEVKEEKIDLYRPDKLTADRGKQMVFGKKDVHLQPALSKNKIHQLLHAASMAPSGGNVQPWKWLVNENKFQLLHDRSRSHSFLDFAHTGSYYAFGSVIENFIIEADHMGMGVDVQLFPKKDIPEYIAELTIKDPGAGNRDQMFRSDLYEAIPIRVTNRKNEGRHEFPTEIKNKLLKTASNWEAADLLLIEKEEDLQTLAEITAEVERLRLLDKQCHHDTIHELRWTEEEVVRTRDGLDIKTLELDKAAEVGIELSKDWEALRYLKEWDLGNAFKESMKYTVMNASAVGLIVMNKPFKPETFIEGGRLGQQLWMESNLHGISFQPISPSTFFFNRMIYGKKIDMNTFMRVRLEGMYDRFLSIFGLERIKNSEQTLVFMFRFNKASAPTARALRLPVEQILLNKG